MQDSGSPVRLYPEQASAAARGIKALMPVAGRPFLDWTLELLPEIGIRSVCLVVAPDSEIREHYVQAHPWPNLKIEFEVQRQPKGTADALLAARPFVGNSPVLLLNSDNYYPKAALKALLRFDPPAVLGIDRAGLLAGGQSNITRERIAAFAILETNKHGQLLALHEKPDAETYSRLPEPVLTNVNCWLFTPKIFEACEAIEASVRGELELGDAAMYASRDLGERFLVVTSKQPILDLSHRSDVPNVERLLAAKAG
jgi:glucose-1-phosphate thymidylyltransferase